MKKQNGYSMVELMWTMTILGVIAFGATMWSMYQAKKETATADASHMNDVRKAVNNALATNYSILINEKSIDRVRTLVTDGRWPLWKRAVPRIGDTGFAVQQDDYRISHDATTTGTSQNNGDQITCSDDHKCTAITMQELRDWGYLDATFPGKSPSGYYYKIIVRRYDIAGQTPSLAAIIATTEPVIDHLKASPQAGVAGKEDDAFDTTAAYTFAGALGSYGGVVRTVNASHMARIPTTTWAARTPADKIALNDTAAFGPGDPVGWFVKGGRWPNITTPGQIAAAAGYWGKDRDEFLCVDGCNSMTADLDMGGNFIVNLGKVDYDSECNNPAGATAEERAKVGALADANITGNGNGNGIKLTCLQDGATGRWRKPSVGVETVDDFKAGLLNGYESNAQKVCLTDSIGNEVVPGAYAAVVNNQVLVKFVSTSDGLAVYGSVAGTDGTFGRIAALTYDTAIGKNFVYSFNPFHVLSEVNNVSSCTSDKQDPYRVVTLPDGRRVQSGIQAQDPTTLSFNGRNITFHSRGTFSRTVANAGINRNSVDLAQANQTVLVPNYNLVTDPVTGSTSLSRVDIQTSVQINGQASTIDTFITSQVGQDATWVLAIPSKCINPDKSSMPNC